MRKDAEDARDEDGVDMRLLGGEVEAVFGRQEGVVREQAEEEADERASEKVGDSG